MLDFSGVQGGISLVLSVALLAVKAFAMIDCIGRPAGSFELRSQLPKNTWLILLALALVAHLVSMNPLGLLNLLGTVAALVYLAQLRGSSY